MRSLQLRVFLFSAIFCASVTGAGEASEGAIGSGASESSQIQESISTREFPDGAKEFRDGPVSVRITSMGKDVPFEKLSDFEFQVSLSVKKIKECFENRQKTKPALRGHVNTKVFVSEKGKVTDMKIHLSNLLDDPTETCLLDEVRAWSFPVTKKKKRVVFVPFDFKGNRVKLTENPEATPAPDRKSPFEVIQDVIHGKLPQVQQCYVQRLRAKPKMAGKVNARFVISANGRVSSARIQSSELSDARTETCIRNTILKWTFPAPRDQKPMTLTYPFTFAPQ